MIKLILKSLKLKNFLSIGDKPVSIEFNQSAGCINIITGENLDKKGSRNGIGKTSILEGLHFVLFGKTMKRIKQDFISNNKTKKSAEGELIFIIGSDEYILQRKLKPSKLFLYKNGIDVTLDTIANNSNYIADLIGFDALTFAQCVMMSMKNSELFMTATAAQKRKIIEQTLDLSKFGDMLKTVNAEYSEFKKSQLTTLTRVDMLNNSVANLVARIKELEDTKARQDEIITARRNTLNTKIADLNSTIASQQKTLDSYPDVIKLQLAKDKLDIEYTECDAAITELTAKIFDTNSQIIQNAKEVKLRMNMDGMCQTCKQPLITHNQEQIDLEKSNLLAQIQSDKIKLANLKEIQAELYSNKNSISTKISNIVTTTSEVLRLVQSIGTNKTLLSTLESDLQNVQYDSFLQKNIDNISNDISKSKDDINKHNEELTKINIQINVLEKAKFILGDDGIKTVLIERVIDLFNSLINNYLTKFESQYYIVFDKYFEEVITAKSGEVVGYHNLSGAESKYVDIAIMLAFADLRSMQSSIDINVLFFDELLDSCVDANGLDNIVKALVQRKESIYVISHRAECKMLADDTGGDCIFLIKQNGQTSRKV